MSEAISTVEQTLDKISTLKVYSRSLNAVGGGTSLRCSARFMHPKFEELRRSVIAKMPTVSLAYLTSRTIQRGVQPEYVEGGVVRVVKTGTLRNGFLDWTEYESVAEDFYQAVQRRAGIRKNDVLIASTGVGSLGKVDVYDFEGLAIADGHVSIVRIDPTSYSVDLLAHVLRHRIVQWQIDQALSGATNQIEISPNQLESLRVPKFPPGIHETLMKETKRINEDIILARVRIRPERIIINEILCEELGFPLVEFMNRVTQNRFSKRFAAISAGSGLRASVKYHHPDYDIVSSFLKRAPHAALRGYLAKPIRLGITATKDELLQDGDAYYVYPGAVKSQGSVNIDTCYFVTDEFYEQAKRRFALQAGDLVLNRAGEGTIGKVAIFRSNVKAVYSDFTMRIRLRDSLDSEFAMYFMRSILFQSQIEREKRGMGNMTNIFPNQVERMLCVSCPISQQKSIAQRINTEIAENQRLIRLIEEKKQQVMLLIGKAIVEHTV